MDISSLSTLECVSELRQHSSSGRAAAAKCWVQGSPKGAGEAVDGSGRPHGDGGPREAKRRLPGDGGDASGRAEIGVIQMGIEKKNRDPLTEG